MAQYGGRQEDNQMRRPNDEYGYGDDQYGTTGGGGAYGAGTGDQYGTAGGYNKADQYGAYGGSTDQYGTAGGYNKTDQQGAYQGGMAPATTDSGVVAGKEGGRHRRSGSATDSSSEEEGQGQEQGGRRKKGLMGKIKDILPGGHKGDSAATVAAEMEGKRE